MRQFYKDLAKNTKKHEIIRKSVLHKLYSLR